MSCLLVLVKVFHYISKNEYLASCRARRV